MEVSLGQALLMAFAYLLVSAGFMFCCAFCWSLLRSPPVVTTPTIKSATLVYSVAGIAGCVIGPYTARGLGRGLTLAAPARPTAIAPDPSVTQSSGGVSVPRDRDIERLQYDNLINHRWIYVRVSLSCSYAPSASPRVPLGSASGGPRLSRGWASDGLRVA